MSDLRSVWPSTLRVDLFVILPIVQSGEIHGWKKPLFSQFLIEDHFIPTSDKATDMYILIRCLIEVLNLTTALDPMITEIIAQRSTRT